VSNANLMKTLCVVAGDFNTDVSKTEISADTASYTDMLLINNVTPAILTPTRIIPKSSTLIDHYYMGDKLKEGTKLITGNFLQHISDHLAIYCNMQRLNAN